MLFLTEHVIKHEVSRVISIDVCLKNGSNIFRFEFLELEQTKQNPI